MKRGAILLLLWAVLPGQAAQYFVELREEPAASVAALSPARDPRAAAVRGRSATRAVQARARGALGIRPGQVRHSYDLLLNGFVAEISAERAKELASRPEVKSVVEFSTPSGLAMDAVLPLINAPRAWDLAPEGTSQGAGVKIGIIDSSLDSAHPAFQDPELTAPEGFPKGNDAADLAKTSGKVIVYRTYNSFAVKGNAPFHGTAVAMAAAGVRYESPIGMISGVAPKAWIGFYALGDIETAAILKAMEDAVADGMDILNLSLGFFAFPAPSQMAPFEVAAERAMRLGVAVVWAAGNLGPERATIMSHSASDANLIVGGTRNSKISGGSLRLPSGQVIPVIPYPGIPDSGEPIRGRLRDVRELDRETGGCVSPPAGSLEGRIALVDVSVECAAREQNLLRAGAIAVLSYLPGIPLSGSGPGNALPAIPAAQIGGAEAAELIRTGASGAEVALDIARQPQPSDPSLPYQTSASGPTPDYKIRPDLSGVAQFVYSALPGNSNSTLSGTSFAAPQVSGGIALLKAARPHLTPQQLYSLVTNTTAKLPHPVMEIGSGRLDLEAAMTASLAALPRSLSFGVSSTPGSGSIGQTRDLAITNLGGDPDVITISIDAAEGRPIPVISPAALTLEAGASARVSVRLDAANARAGEYEGSILITGANSGTRLRVPYWFAIPSGIPGAIKVVLTDQYVAGGTYSTFGRMPEFRVIDTTGLPMSNVTPQVSASGAASLLFVDRDPGKPAVFAAGLRFAAAPGEALLRIQAGQVIQDVTFRTVTPVNPRIEFPNPLLDFGDVLLGMSRDLDLTVTNTGGQPLVITQATSSNSQFVVVAPRLPITVARGAQEKLTVRFTPSAATSATARLTLAHNDGTQSGLFTNMSGAGVPAAGPLTLKADGGRTDFAIGYPGGEPTAIFVNRLTPPKYPAVLQSVQIYFRDRPDGLARNTPLTILARPNPDGTERLRDLVFLRQQGTVGQLNAFSTYPFPAGQTLRIDSGDFVVGFQVNNPPRVFPAELDRFSAPQRRSYVASENRPFSLVEVDAGVAGNFLIRAVVSFPQQ